MQMLAGARGRLGACTSACSASALRAPRSKARPRSPATLNRGAHSLPGSGPLADAAQRLGSAVNSGARASRGAARAPTPASTASGAHCRRKRGGTERSATVAVALAKRARAPPCGAEIDDRTTTNPNRRARPGGGPQRGRHRRNDHARGRSRRLAGERQHRHLRRDPRGRRGARRPARVGVPARSRRVGADGDRDRAVVDRRDLLRRLPRQRGGGPDPVRLRHLLAGLLPAGLRRGRAAGPRAAAARQPDAVARRPDRRPRRRVGLGGRDLRHRPAPHARPLRRRRDGSRLPGRRSGAARRCWSASAWPPRAACSRARGA